MKYDNFDKSIFIFTSLISCLLCIFIGITIGESVNNSHLEEIINIAVPSIMGGVIAIYVAKQFTAKTIYKEKLEICGSKIKEINEESNFIISEIFQNFYNVERLFSAIKNTNSINSKGTIEYIRSLRAKIRLDTTRFMFLNSLIEDDKCLKLASEAKNEAEIIFDELSIVLDEFADFNNLDASHRIYITNDILSKNGTSFDKFHYYLIESDKHRVRLVNIYKVLLNELGLI